MNRLANLMRLSIAVTSVVTATASLTIGRTHHAQAGTGETRLEALHLETSPATPTTRRPPRIPRARSGD